MADKSSVRGGPGLNRARSGKDEPKIPIIYTLRNPSALGKVAQDNPEPANGAIDMIDASGAKGDENDSIR